MPYKYSKKRPTKRKRNYRRKPSKSLVKTIKSVVNRQVETKAAFHAQALTAFNGNINAISDILRIIPNVTTGVEDANRIGSRVMARGVKIKGHLLLSRANSTNTNYTRVAVRLMVVQPKQCQSWTTITGTSFGTGWIGSLLQKGATSVPFDGQISDLYCSIDPDMSVVYYDKIHYLSVPQLFSTAAGIATQDLSQTVKFFNINLPIKKAILYNDSIDSLQPQNCAPVVLMGYTYLDGAAADAAANVSIAFDSIFSFKDA